ncbi:hypothetical protein GCM10028774_13730 [Spirosoma jeollabukense]
MGEFPTNNVVGTGGANGPSTYYGNFHMVFGIKGLTSDAKVRPRFKTNQPVYNKTSGPIYR